MREVAASRARTWHLAAKTCPWPSAVQGQPAHQVMVKSSMCPCFLRFRAEEDEEVIGKVRLFTCKRDVLGGITGYLGKHGFWWPPHHIAGDVLKERVSPGALLSALIAATYSANIHYL